METELVETNSEPIELKKLSPRHHNVAALLAQGVPRSTIADITDYTPEYVTWLQRQPLFMQYIKEMSQANAVRLEALFEKSVTTITDAMDNGNMDERLKGAKLQLEATGRIGRFQTQVPDSGGQDKLEVLADRLKQLLYHQRRTVNGEVTDAEIVSEGPVVSSQGGGGAGIPAG